MGSLPESYSDPLDLLEVLVLSPILTTGRKIFFLLVALQEGTQQVLIVRELGFWKPKSFRISEEDGSQTFSIQGAPYAIIDNTMLFAYLLHLSHS